MNRDHESERDEQIAARTERHFTALLASLTAGNQKLVHSVDDDLSHLFTDREVMGRLIVLAVTDKHQAGAVLEQLIHGVLRTEAEVAAIKEVEKIERERDEDFAELDASMITPAKGPWRHLARA